MFEINLRPVSSEIHALALPCREGSNGRRTAPTLTGQSSSNSSNSIVVAAVRNVQVLLYCIIYRYCVPCVCNALQNDEVVLSYFWQSYARACATSAHVYLAC